ncbi:MAG: hypothetical protein NZ742_07300 [Acidobacteria bacterium]|nr:hypothetical protein [Acidobacteriota bacterium]MDW7984634.1 hypothetical protein [Acidobacteriota bacterium]
MLAILWQAQLIRALFVVTVAWQAFIYGWTLSASGLPAPEGSDRPPNLSTAWTAQARPPLGALLERVIETRDQTSALAALGFHALWTWMALVLARTHASEWVSGLWGYMLAVWNPLALYGVIARRWDVLLSQSLLALGFYVWLHRRWMTGFYLNWTALAVDLHALFWWPALAGRILRLRGSYRFALAVLPGILLMAWMLAYTGWRGWVRGWGTWWWGPKLESTWGWNVWTFLTLAPATDAQVGWFSLLGWLLGTLGLVVAYAVGALRFRTLMTWCGVLGWLLFWRSHFIEMGLALYWVGLYIAHGARFHRKPLLTSAEAEDPE